MFNIEEDQLKLLLEKKRKIIERKKYDGIGEIISAISLMITLVLSDFSHLEVIKPGYFKFGAWSIAWIILIYGTYEFIQSLKGYSIEQLYCEIMDLDPKIEHPFDIIIIRNSTCGKYLVFKSKRWRCWLFPNYHCLEGVFGKAKEIKYIKKCLQRDLNISEDIECKYIGNKLSEKYSAADKVRKKYNFHYFEITNLTFENDKKGRFRSNGKKYCWKTLDQMYANKNIVKKNKDVLDYVRRMCDLS